MIQYNPHQALISLHIPKCAGQSFRQVLKIWFGNNFHVHYFQQHNALPPIHPLKPGMCIHGHFQRDKKMGVFDYYPKARQFITILRDPLEIAISNYFFWKRKARARQLQLGLIREGDENDYQSIEDFFLKRPRSHILNFLPPNIKTNNFKEVLKNRFIWIGLVENLQDSIQVLAKRLNKQPLTIDCINVSPRDEELSPGIRQLFIQNNKMEFDIYNYINEGHID